ncbi:helix-turn-helix transcriptional regulator [Rhodobacteraceae bacterium]|nr:helix-turn-helix transcriptional regulator [Paracoccaceae bacterium]
MTPAEFKAARKQLGHTQAQLAALIKTDPSTIRRWEMEPDRSTATPASPLATQVMQWLLDGFRPPEFPKSKP